MSELLLGLILGILAGSVLGFSLAFKALRWLIETKESFRRELLEHIAEMDERN